MCSREPDGLTAHQIFVLASSLNELMQAPALEKSRLAREGTLIPIGHVEP